MDNHKLHDHLSVEGDIYNLMNSDYFQTLQISFYFVGGILGMLTTWIVYFAVEQSAKNFGF